MIVGEDSDDYPIWRQLTPDGFRELSKHIKYVTETFGRNDGWKLIMTIFGREGEGDTDKATVI